MGIELDLFCLNANYRGSDRLRSSAPSNAFASALPGQSFYLEDLHWGKVGMGSKLSLSRVFPVDLWCSQCKSLSRVKCLLSASGVLSVFSVLAATSTGCLQACLPVSFMIRRVLKGIAAKILTSQEKLSFH